MNWAPEKIVTCRLPYQFIEWRPNATKYVKYYLSIAKIYTYHICSFLTPITTYEWKYYVDFVINCENERSSPLQAWLQQTVIMRYRFNTSRGIFRPAKWCGCRGLLISVIKSSFHTLFNTSDNTRNLATLSFKFWRICKKSSKWKNYWLLIYWEDSLQIEFFEKFFLYYGHKTIMIIISLWSQYFSWNVEIYFQNEYLLLP